MYSDELIKELPKSDLHLHFDGSLRIPTLIDIAQKEKITLPAYSEEGLREFVFKDSYNNLGEYLHGFMYTCAALRTAENIERCAYELAIDNQKEGVRYIEVRFAPQLHIDNKGLTMEVIFESLNKGLARAEKEFNKRKEIVEGKEPPFKYGIIACAMRMCSGAFSPYYESLFNAHQYSAPMDVIKLGALELVKGIVKIRDERGIPIVGFDLAGQEDGYPAEDFKEAYEYAHRNFLHKTVHAGEAYGAESIFQAITDLHADRIGHGFYLFDTEKVGDDVEDKEKYVNNLASFVADTRTTIEICLTSNMQTNPAIKDIKNHTVKQMLDKKLSITVCTDNRLVSNTTVSKELRLLLDNFDVSPKALQNIIAYGFKRSFYPGQYHEKRVYARQVMDYYQSILEKHNIAQD